MPSWNRSLRPIDVTSKKHSLSVQLQGSMRLDLTPHDVQNLQDLDIVDAVRDHGVWIAKAGLCHVRFSFCVDRECVCGKEDVRHIIETIQNCGIWIRLGLRVRYMGEPTPLIASDLAFSIHHPDISSTLITPNNVTKSELRSLSYSIVITKWNTIEGKTKRKRRTSTPKATAPATKARKVDYKPERDKFYDRLDLVDQQTIDELVKSLGFGSTTGDLQQVDADGRDGTQALVMNHVTTLIPMLLNLATVGTTRPVDGFIPDYRINPDHTLCKLAPGVFHCDYLQKLSEGAELIPAIARSLAAMRNAETVSLRKKVQRQQTDGSIGERGGTKMGILYENLQGQLWRSMLRYMKAPPLRSKESAAPTTSSPMPEDDEVHPVEAGSSMATVTQDPVQSWSQFPTYSMPMNPLTGCPPTLGPTSIPFNTTCIPAAGYTTPGSNQCHQVFAYPHVFAPSNVQPFPLPNPVHYYGYQPPAALPTPQSDDCQREADQQYQSFEDMLFDI